MTINEINSNILHNQSNDTDDIFDYIFDTFDDLLIANQFELCDELLSIIINSIDMYIDVTLYAILPIVSVWSLNLNMYESFLNAVYSKLKPNYTIEELKQSLNNF